MKDLNPQAVEVVVGADKLQHTAAGQVDENKTSVEDTQPKILAILGKIETNTSALLRQSATQGAAEFAVPTAVRGAANQSITQNSNTNSVSNHHSINTNQVSNSNPSNTQQVSIGQSANTINPVVDSAVLAGGATNITDSVSSSTVSAPEDDNNQVVTTTPDRGTADAIVSGRANTSPDNVSIPVAVNPPATQSDTLPGNVDNQDSASNSDENGVSESAQALSAQREDREKKGFLSRVGDAFQSVTEKSEELGSDGNGKATDAAGSAVGGSLWDAALEVKELADDVTGSAIGQMITGKGSGDDEDEDDTNVGTATRDRNGRFLSREERQRRAEGENGDLQSTAVSQINNTVDNVDVATATAVDNSAQASGGNTSEADTDEVSNQYQSDTSTESVVSTVAVGDTDNGQFNAANSNDESIVTSLGTGEILNEHQGSNTESTESVNTSSGDNQASESSSSTVDTDEVLNQHQSDTSTESVVSTVAVGDTDNGQFSATSSNDESIATSLGTGEVLNEHQGSNTESTESVNASNSDNQVSESGSLTVDTNEVLNEYHNNTPESVDTAAVAAGDSEQIREISNAVVALSNTDGVSNKHQSDTSSTTVEGDSSDTNQVLSEYQLNTDSGDNSAPTVSEDKAVGSELVVAAREKDKQTDRITDRLDEQLVVTESNHKELIKAVESSGGGSGGSGSGDDDSLLDMLGGDDNKKKGKNKKNRRNGRRTKPRGRFGKMLDKVKGKIPVPDFISKQASKISTLAKSFGNSTVGNAIKSGGSKIAGGAKAAASSVSNSAVGNTVKAGGQAAGKAAGGALRTVGSVASKAAAPIAALTAGYFKYDEIKDRDDLTGGQKSVQVGATTAGSMGGASAGMMAGAAMGSVIPVVGTVIGGILGAALGGWLGSKGGDIVGETVTDNMKGTDGLTASERELKTSEMNKDTSAVSSIAQSETSQSATVVKESNSELVQAKSVHASQEVEVPPSQLKVTLPEVPKAPLHVNNQASGGDSAGKTAVNNTEFDYKKMGAAFEKAMSKTQQSNVAAKPASARYGGAKAQQSASSNQISTEFDDKTLVLIAHDRI